MTFITGKYLSRRALIGGAISLPLLDAMRPAFAAPAKAGLKANRVAVVYVPNGIVMNQWTPTGTGSDFTFSRILKPLEPFKADINIVANLTNPAAGRAKGGGHAKASGSFLSAAEPKLTMGSDVHAGLTFDQLAAKKFASETRVASLQLGCEDSRMVGNCDTGSSCAYTNSISWRDADTPMMVEVNPRSVFERLFGNIDPSLSPEVRAKRAHYRRSILDRSMENTQKLVATLGAPDRRKIDEYLTSIREVEKRIELAEKDTELPPVEKPSGIPFQFAEYVKLMFDLQAIAFQSDLTRVSTMMIGREGSVRTYPEIGVPDPHHPLTHHRGHPDFIEKVTKINCFHVELFAYFLQKLKSTPDGDGSLLDHSTILYGGAISDGNQHSYVNLPLLVAGRAGGQRGGRYVQAPPMTPVANLFVNMLDRVGVPTETFGDSTGRLDLNV